MYLPSALKNNVAQVAAVLCPLDSGYCGGLRFTGRLRRGAQVQKGRDIVIVHLCNLVFLIATTYNLVIILSFFLNDSMQHYYNLWRMSETLVRQVKGLVKEPVA